MDTLTAPPTTERVADAPPAKVTVAELLGVKVGDIFYNSWGYDQTNIDFYKVTRITRTKVELLAIGARCEGSSGHYNALVPDPTTVRTWDVIIASNRDNPGGVRKLCALRAGYRGEPTAVLRSGEHWATRWSGRLMYETDSMFGH